MGMDRDDFKVRHRDELEKLKGQFAELHESNSRVRKLQEALKYSEKLFHEAEEALKQRIRLEQIVKNISIKLIGVDSDKLDDAINEALKMVGKFTGVDRGYVLLFSEKMESMRNTHRWRADEVELPVDNFEKMFSLMAPWWASRFERHDSIYIPVVKSLPPEADSGKETLEALDIQSLIAVPMVYKSRLLGFVGFDWMKQEKTWTREDIAILRTVSSIFAMALERKRSEEQRQKLEEQLLHAQKAEAIGTLAGGIAHDFNNILGAIIGYAELAMDDLYKDQKGSPIEFNLEQVLRAAERAKEIIKQVLSFTRKREGEKRVIYLESLTRETLKMMRSTLPTTIDIRIEIGKHLNPVMADPTQINQLLLNICTNAGYAMREKGGILEVELKEIEIEPDNLPQAKLVPGRYQVLRVRDTGTGMTPDTRCRIFEPYFTTKKFEEGTGIGLSVVHGIIENHKGHITVDSEVDKGTTFHVYVPVILSTAAAKTIMPQDQSIQRGSERVLLVDDEQSLVDVRKEMLVRLGYRVVGKTSSIEALEEFRAAPDQFDLVITDQTMPQMTGTRLARELKNIRPEVPVILCTGFSESINEENFKDLDVDGFLMKPVVLKEIARKIRDVLKKPVTDGL
jgi:signal transduction histidine kinase/ActR/RegA family two-component response regulator